MLFRKKDKYSKYSSYIVDDLCNITLEAEDVPQGVCQVSGNVLISCYTTNKTNSKVLIIDSNSKLKKVINLDNNAHVGGISYDNYHNLIWICDKNGSVSCYPYNEFIRDNFSHRVNFKVSSSELGGGVLMENNQYICSYLTYFENKLYVGSFNKYVNGLVKVFSIDRGIDGICLNYESEFVVPNIVQGLEFYRDNEDVYLICSRSYTRKSDSQIVVYLYDKNQRDYSKEQYSFILPPMLEQISIDSKKNTMLLFESCANKYKADVKVVIDKISTLNTAVLIDDYKNIYKK